MNSFELTKYEVERVRKIDLNKVKEGDVIEREKLVNKYLKLIKNLSKVNGYIDEDIMQELLYILLGKAVKTYDSSKGIKFSTYFVNLAKNAKYNYLKKENIRNHLSIQNENEEDISFIEILFSDMDLEKDFIDKEVKKILKDIIEDLSKKHQKIIELYYGFGNNEIHTFKEIGDNLGFSKQYAEKELNKVKGQIKNRLKWEGVF